MTSQKVWNCDICDKIFHSPRYERGHLIIGINREDIINGDLCRWCYNELMNIIAEKIKEKEPQK